MQTDDIAQRFAKRRDFELVDMAMVALPMYAVTMECICCVHRPFPPMALFVLRAIKAGLSSETEIAGFLGVEAPVLRITLRELTEDRYISDEGTGKYALMDLGTKVIEDEKEYVPEEETHTVIFDGILRRPVWISGERLLRPSEIDRVTTIEIRPYPGMPPEIGELKLADVIAVLKSQYGAEEFDRDLLSLSRITRRSKVFRIATGLAYKMKKGPEVQIAFVVDGVPHNELEQVFAEKGGARKMGFMKALSEEGIERGIRRHLGNDVVNLLPDETELQGRFSSLATARRDLDIAGKRAESEPNASNLAQLEESKSRYGEMVRSIQTYKARPLEVHEVSNLLDDALVSATEQIFVAVGESWDAGITRDLLRRLEATLKRGVEIRILSLIKSKEEGAERPRSEKLAEVLRVLGRYRNLTITPTRRHGFFFLVKDRQFAAIANRPLLGPASRTRMFHQFAGYLLQERTLVDAYVSRLGDVYWSDLRSGQS